MTQTHDTEDLKTYLEPYVKTITRPSKNGFYVCPLCGSGSEDHERRDSDGAFSIYNNGLNFKCFSGSCGASGDIFELIRLHEKIERFPDQVKRAKEFAKDFGKIPDTGVNTNSTNKRQQAQVSKADYSLKDTKRIGQYKTYIEECHERAGNTEYFMKRGFTMTTVKRFKLGYDPTFKGGPAVIIPYDKKLSYYLARYERTNTNDSKAMRFYKPKTEEAGPEPIFNAGALSGRLPIFICESPFDAISIMQENNKCAAVAIGGTGTRKLIDFLYDHKPNAPLIISLDQDGPGQQEAYNLAEELDALGLTYIKASYSELSYPKGFRKDTNDFLRGNQEQFKKDIEDNIKCALERLGERKEEEKADLESKNARNKLIGFLDRIKASQPAIRTGYDELDEELDGGLFPGLYVLGAISSLGKTTFLLQMADQIAQQEQKDLLYFSLEMSTDELISKSISRLSYTLKGREDIAKTARGITTYKRYEFYNDEELENIDNAIDAYSKYANRLYFVEGVGDIGVNQIVETAQRHTDITGQAPIIIIDYFQILAPYDPRQSDKQNTDKNILELKRLSRDLNTPVITVSSFNRQAYNNGAQMTAFKESGAIEYSADVLLTLQPQKTQGGDTQSIKKKNFDIMEKCKRDYERLVELVILKNRNGKTGGKIGFVYKTLFNDFEPDLMYDPLAQEEETPFKAKSTQKRDIRI